MRLGKISMIVVCGLVGGLALMPAVAEDAMMEPPDIASMSVDDIIELRIETMRSNGRTLRGANLLSGAEAIAAAEQIRHNAEILHSLFPEGSNTGESNALDLIWQDWDDFVAILDSLQTDAGAMIAAAQDGDQGAYVAAVRQVGGNCGACHDTFRAEREN